MKVLQATLITDIDEPFIEVYIEAEWDYLVEECDDELEEYFVNLNNAYPPGVDTSNGDEKILSATLFGDHFPASRIEADELFIGDIYKDDQIFDMFIGFAYRKAKEYLLTTDLDFNSIPLTLRFPNPRRINPDGTLNENYYKPEE